MNTRIRMWHERQGSYLRWEKDTVMHARLARLPSSSHLRSAITTTPLRALAVCKYHAIHKGKGDEQDAGSNQGSWYINFVNMCKLGHRGA